MNKGTQVLTVIIGAIFFLAIVCVIIAYPVMWLWNGCLVGAVDGVHEISFFQALGLALLCSLLFKSTSSSSKS